MLENINGDIIQQLNAFHFILQYGSISKAASALNKSPSSVSRLMQQLED
ncbi:MAG: LysR family transcriptional regulator, partial [Mailhella sp.]|nr:LysR family transcriptional regulator [Mailhella sp.]